MREAEIRAEAVVHNGVDRQIVQPAEDALLGHPQDAGEKAEAQMTVILQAAGEQIAHEQDDLIVKAPGMALLDRGVIFVYDDNRRDLVMLVEHAGQGQQRAGKLHIACCPLHDAAEIRLVHVVAGFCSQQFLMARKLAADDIG